MGSTEDFTHLSKNWIIDYKKHTERGENKSIQILKCLRKYKSCYEGIARA